MGKARTLNSHLIINALIHIDIRSMILLGFSSRHENKQRKNRIESAAAQSRPCRTALESAATFPTHGGIFAASRCNFLIFTLFGVVNKGAFR